MSTLLLISMDAKMGKIKNRTLLKKSTKEESILL